MALHNFKFFFCKLCRLIQNRIRYTNFSNIMQQTNLADVLNFLFVQSKLYCNQH